MINGLIPMLGAGAITSGMNQTSDNYGTNPDGSFDPVGYGGGMAGLAAGGALGALAGRSLSNKYALKNTTFDKLKGSEMFKSLDKKKQKSLLKEATLKGREASTVAKVEGKGLASLLKGGKGGIASAIAKNPKLAMGGGAALGAMLGAKLLGGNLTAGTHATKTTQMQNYANQDATNQQEDAYAIQNASRISF